MAIEGPVRELALTDLLQLLFLSRRTGSLVVRDDVTGQSMVLELENGVLTGASGTSPETRLGRLLVGSGRATDGQIEAALSAQRLTPDRRLGEILVGSGSVREAEIRRQLRFQIEEAVFDLMRWKDGHLRFEEHSPRPVGPIEVRLPTDLVLMDAVRRLDEWTEVTSTAPDPDPLPQLAGGAASADQPLSLEPLEWEVLAKVDGENTLKRIARSLGRAELEVARAIYSLALAGVVEIRSHGHGVAASNGGADATEAEVRAAEAALVAGRTEDADRRVRALLALRPGAAPLHVLSGRVLAQRGDWEGAMRTFGRAVELDPLLPTAYYHLARAAIRKGELERASSVLTTYLRLSDGSPTRRVAAERIAKALEQLRGALEKGFE
jgi:hypothetical protein